MNGMASSPSAPLALAMLAATSPAEAILRVVNFDRIVYKIVIAVQF